MLLYRLVLQLLIIPIYWDIIGLYARRITQKWANQPYIISMASALELRFLCIHPSIWFYELVKNKGIPLTYEHFDTKNSCITKTFEDFIHNNTVAIDRHNTKGKHISLYLYSFADMLWHICYVKLDLASGTLLRWLLEFDGWYWMYKICNIFITTFKYQNLISGSLQDIEMLCKLPVMYTYVELRHSCRFE